MVDIVYFVLNRGKLAPWITIFITCEMLFIQKCLVSFLWTNDRQEITGGSTGWDVVSADAIILHIHSASTGSSPVQPVSSNTPLCCLSGKL